MHGRHQDKCGTVQPVAKATGSAPNSNLNFGTSPLSHTLPCSGDVARRSCRFQTPQPGRKDANTRFEAQDLWRRDRRQQVHRGDRGPGVVSSRRTRRQGQLVVLGWLERQHGATGTICSEMSFPGLRAASKRQKASPFCDICGTVLDGESPKCVSCGFEKTNRSSVVSSSSRQLQESETLKELLRARRRQGDDGDENGVQGAPDGDDQAAVIQEQCPQCKHIGLSFRTAQLRSADEGQTIFYTCLKCKHKFSVNS